MNNETVHDFVIGEQYRGQRLDKALAELLPDYSRSRLQAWLRDGRIQVDGDQPKPKERLAGGEHVIAHVAPEREPEVVAQAIPLSILYEDEALLVIDKPAGLVMHPGAGNRDGTLQNALLAHDPALARVPRAGIVHRLDKDTSGLLVVARTLRAHKQLVAALQQREVKREYEAVVCGVMTAGGRVEAALGRHPVDRKRMDVREDGRPAVTHYRVLRRFRAHTHVRLQLETGRTHQIRVHMRHIRYPLLGDSVYGQRLALPAGASQPLRDMLTGFKRQALHARRLALAHPYSGARMEWESQLPADLRGLLDVLASDRQSVEKA